MADPVPDPEIQIETQDMRQKIWRAMAELPPEQRAVVVMRYYLDFNEAEISAHTQSPKGTVKWRLHVARKRLRKLLQPNNAE